MSIINTLEEYNSLKNIYDFSEKNSLSFLNNLKNINEDISKKIEVKNFKLLGPELRAIVPDKVYSYIEFTSDKKYIIWHKEMNISDLFLKEQINECVWYSIIILLLNEHNKAIIDNIAPYTSSQPNSMFPFNPLKYLLSEDNLTHNKIIFNDLAYYENICLRIYKYIND